MISYRPSGPWPSARGRPHNRCERTTPAKYLCPACASANLSVFFELLKVPVHIGLQWPSREAARDCPRGDIELAYCQECGFLSNLAFNPAQLDYAQSYDNSLHFSQVFQAYARSVASRLIARYGLYGKDIVEIGCGRGEFLSLLCELGNNRGVGFDPTGDEKGGTDRITFIHDVYSERYAEYRGDLVCCRYVLEHIPGPIGFLKMLRRIVGQDRNTVMYFEVPNALFILRDLSAWDIIYEHCSYFSQASLARTFTESGFDVVDLKETYKGQFLGVEATPGHLGAVAPLKWEALDEMAHQVAVFATRYQGKLEAWWHRLERLKRRGKRAVLWGAGAKGVSFLNIFEALDPVEYVVDINPRKQGKHIAGTGQRIIGPELLPEHRPDVVIVMNPIYRDEIGETVRRFGLRPVFLCV